MQFPLLEGSARTQHAFGQLAVKGLSSLEQHWILQRTRLGKGTG